METLDGDLQNRQSLAWYHRALRGKLLVQAEEVTWPCIGQANFRNSKSGGAEGE